MSLMPKGSDDIAGLLGVGALVGALSGARAPRRGSRPGLLSTLLARSIEEERVAQEARVRQEQAQMAFLGSIAPKMLEMGIPMGEIFNNDVYARMGINPDEMNRAITTAATRSMMPILQQYAPHATQEQLAGVTAGDWNRLAEFYASDANRDAHRNVAAFPALLAQLGSAGGLKALSGMSPEGRAESGDGSMFSDTGGFLSILGEGLRRAEDQEFARADALNANAAGRNMAMQRLKHSHDMALTDREIAGRAALKALEVGVSGNLNNAQETLDKTAVAVKGGLMTAQEGDFVKKRLDYENAFNKEVSDFVLPWFAAPRNSSGDTAADALFWKQAGLAASGPDERLKQGVGFIIDKHFPRLAEVGFREEDIMRWTSQIGVPAYGPSTIKRYTDTAFEEKAKSVQDDMQARDYFQKNAEEIYKQLERNVVDELTKTGIVYGVF